MPEFLHCSSRFRTAVVRPLVVVGLGGLTAFCGVWAILAGKVLAAGQAPPLVAGLGALVVLTLLAGRRRPSGPPEGLQTQGSAGSPTALLQGGTELQISRAIIHSLHDPIYCKDCDGLFIEANRAFCELVGKSRNEILGRSDTHIFPPDEQRQYADEQRQVLASVEPLEFEAWTAGPDGSLRLYSKVKSRLTDGAGKVIGMICIGRDITVRKRRESELKLASEVIEEKESLLRNLIDSTPDPIFLKDELGRFVLVNTALAQAVGLDPSELIGRTEAEVLPESFSGPSIDLERRVRRCGETAEAELPLKGSAGETLWYSLIKSPFADSGQRVAGVIGVARDITDRKRFEDQLRESEARYEMAVSGSNDGLWDWNVASGVVYLSPRWKEIVGYGPDELEDRFETFESLIHPEDRERILRNLQQYMESGRRLFRAEFRQVHRDGRCRWILSRALAERDKEGRTLRMVGSHTDITERKRAEEALKESEARFRAMAVNVPGVLFQWVADTAGKRAFQYVSPLCRDFLEVGPYTLMENWHALRPHPEDAVRYFESLEEAFRTRTGWSYQGRFVLPSGKVRWLRGAARPISVTPDEVLFNGLLSDETETVIAQQEIAGAKDRAEQLAADLANANADLEVAVQQARDLAEKAESANRAKSQFLANVSHDMRTPLNGIIGFLPLLQKTNLDPNAREYADSITRSAESLLALINDLLDLSKIEAGQFHLDEKPFSPRDCLENVLNSLAANANAKGINLRTESRDPLPSRVVGDGRRLTQVLFNIVGNAVKFTSAGEVVVRTRSGTVQGQAGEEHELEFSVSDTGPGIDPDHLEQIFRPFLQSASAVSNEAGTGLGLAISQQLSRLMGGDIWVQSEPDRGSTFTFSIRCGRTEHAGEGVENPGNSSRHLDRRLAERFPLEILLVDDARLNRVVLNASLREMGYSTSEAASGMEALEKYHKNQYDLVFMDFRMPEMDGIETTRRLRSWEAENLAPGVKPAYVVALTADAMKSDMDRSRVGGMDDYLTKPIQLDQIRAVLESAWRQRMGQAAEPGPENHTRDVGIAG